jgi:hypothetical protein
MLEKRHCSRYSDRLLAERPKARSSCPSKVKKFHFSTPSKPVLGTAQSLINWVQEGGGLSGGVEWERL